MASHTRKSSVDLETSILSTLRTYPPTTTEEIIGKFSKNSWGTVADSVLHDLERRGLVRSTLVTTKVHELTPEGIKELERRSLQEDM